jgi:lauroyl/myristoyl acyltransferase
MKASSDLQRWRYYFLDLPLWACGVRTSQVEKRLFSFFEPEIPAFRDGYLNLCAYMGRPVSDAATDAVIRKIFRVKIVRESDAYACLKMSKKQSSRYFITEGIEHLRAAMETKRPIIILSGHFGSFYTAKIAFSHLGIAVHPVARVVDYSPMTPLARSLYEELNYRFTQLRYLGRYIFTDFSGRIERSVVELFRAGGILWASIDLPYRLYPHKHLPVTLFGQPATLPAGLIQWAVRKGAIFLTAWNSVEVSGGGEDYRRLTIDSPVPDNSTASSVLQVYADRLSDRVAREPWQWLALPIIKQYGENEGAAHG